MPYDINLVYYCETCNRVVKSYALRFWTIPEKESSQGTLAEVEKIGEWPPFSPRTPAKLITLIGPDRELFLKGRRAEIEGLGIGAFCYYRRIIEDQKNRLLDETIRVAKHLGDAADTIGTLEAAKKETQFKKAMEMVREAIPVALYIEGHNPFTLLHGALSEGLHDATDEECLILASAVRLVLIEFAEKLAAVMSDKKEVRDAVARLANRQRRDGQSADLCES
jgi:hypothetical protein